MRGTPILAPMLCGLLALAAGGRFAAEAQMRESRAELRALERERDAEAARADRLRLEVEVLEAADRFEAVNARTLNLQAPAPEQLSRSEDFAETIGRTAAPVTTPEGSDLIGNAITMSDPEAVPQNLRAGGAE